jgi:hypothetical protein
MTDKLFKQQVPIKQQLTLKVEKCLKFQNSENSTRSLLKLPFQKGSKNFELMFDFLSCDLYDGSTPDISLKFANQAFGPLNN